MGSSSSSALRGAGHTPQTPHLGAWSRGPHVLLPELYSGVSVTPLRLLLSAAVKRREGENFLSAGFPPQPLGEFPLAPAPGENLFSSSFSPLSPQGQDGLPAGRACWGTLVHTMEAETALPPREGQCPGANGDLRLQRGEETQKDLSGTRRPASSPLPSSHQSPGPQ